MSLNRARILSSENDASVKQEQNTNVEIKFKPTMQPTPLMQSNNVAYPNIPQVPQFQNAQTRDVNFTIPEGNIQSQFQPTTSNLSREISLGNEIEDLTLKNKFLETLLSIYEVNPLRVNSYLVCHSSSLMELIKILTKADKVELVIDDESGCTGCVSKSKYLNIQRILVTKGDKSNDLKYAYNDVYAQLVKYGISLKLCV